MKKKKPVIKRERVQTLPEHYMAIDFFECSFSEIEAKFNEIRKAYPDYYDFEFNIDQYEDYGGGWTTDLTVYGLRHETAEEKKKREATARKRKRDAKKRRQEAAAAKETEEKKQLRELLKKYKKDLEDIEKDIDV